jgi:hypothetical protein
MSSGLNRLVSPSVPAIDDAKGTVGLTGSEQDG